MTEFQLFKSVFLMLLLDTSDGANITKIIEINFVLRKILMISGCFFCK